VQNTTPSDQTAPDFNFTPMTGWVAREPIDKSFSVSFGASETYAACTDKPGILLIGIVSGSFNEATCGSIKSALLPSDANPTLPQTNIAIGPSEALWDKSDATPVTVTLPQGEKASRYLYTNTTNGVQYTIVEYDTTYQDKDYVAVWHWRYDQGEPGMPQNYFDTFVQKTLTFN
jgi:hypothetical protein